MPRPVLATALLATLLITACNGSSAPGTTEVAAAGDPAQAVLDASARFSNVRTFQASMRLERPGATPAIHSTLTFVAPDRYRLQMPEGEQTIIGDTFFLHANGEMRQVPAPPGLLAQWRNPLPAGTDLHGISVEDRGPAQIDGTQVRHYLLLAGAEGGDRLQYWIAADGLPRQIQREGQANGQPYRITLQYTRLNDPALRVDLPAAGPG